MKKIVLTLIAIGALSACKKKETIDQKAKTKAVIEQANACTNQTYEIVDVPVINLDDANYSKKYTKESILKGRVSSLEYIFDSKISSQNDKDSATLYISKYNILISKYSNDQLNTLYGYQYIIHYTYKNGAATSTQIIPVILDANGNFMGCLSYVDLENKEPYLGYDKTLLKK